MPRLRVRTAGADNQVISTNLNPATTLEGEIGWELKVSCNNKTPEKFIFSEEALRDLAAKINRIFNT